MYVRHVVLHNFKSIVLIKQSFKLVSHVINGDKEKKLFRRA